MQKCNVFINMIFALTPYLFSKSKSQSEVSTTDPEENEGEREERHFIRRLSNNLLRNGVPEEKTSRFINRNVDWILETRPTSKECKERLRLVFKMIICNGAPPFLRLYFLKPHFSGKKRRTSSNQLAKEIMKKRREGL